MIKGKTSSGFEYQFPKENLENYELLETLAELEDNPLATVRAIDLLLGKEQTEKLKDHVRTESGVVPTEAMGEEVKEIFESQAENENVKNS